MIDSAPGHGEGQVQRLEALKARIERGEYRVPAERVADAIILWYRRVEPGQSDVSSSTSS